MYIILIVESMGLIHNRYDKITMPTNQSEINNVHVSAEAKIATSLIPEYPAILDISPEIREAVFGPHLNDPFSPASERNRPKAVVIRNYQKTMTLYKILKSPRPVHLLHLNGLDLSQLQDTETVRKRLVERLEFSRQITPSRQVVFGHLWKDIVRVGEPGDVLHLPSAYPSLIPEVCCLLDYFYIHFFIYSFRLNFDGLLRSSSSENRSREV